MRPTFDRFTEEPSPLIPRPERDHRSEDELERRDWRIDADLEHLRPFMQRKGWVEGQALNQLELGTRTEELVRLGYLEPQRKGRWGDGFVATSKLLNS